MLKGKGCSTIYGSLPSSKFDYLNHVDKFFSKKGIRNPPPHKRSVNAPLGRLASRPREAISSAAGIAILKRLFHFTKTHSFEHILPVYSCVLTTIVVYALLKRVIRLHLLRDVLTSRYHRRLSYKPCLSLYRGLCSSPKFRFSFSSSRRSQHQLYDSSSVRTPRLDLQERKDTKEFSTLHAIVTALFHPSLSSRGCLSSNPL